VGPYDFILTNTDTSFQETDPFLTLRDEPSNDTIFACTQKLTYSQLNLPHGTNKQEE